MIKYGVVMADLVIVFRSLLKKLPEVKHSADTIINHRFEKLALTDTEQSEKVRYRTEVDRSVHFRSA